MNRAELSRPVAVARIADGTKVNVEADGGECGAVARRLLVPSVEALRCLWTLHPSSGGVVVAQGELVARLHQECVVTLDPFPAEVTESFTVHFVPAGREGNAADDPEEPDEVPYEGATLDLGEATVEQLALSLDPYPRKPGATLPDSVVDEGPFGALLRRVPPQ